MNCNELFEFLESRTMFSISPVHPVAPAAPKNLTEAITAGGVKLNWTEKASSATGFVVQRMVNGSATVTIATITGNVTTFTDTMPVMGNDTYVIRAFNSMGTGAASNSVTASIVTKINRAR